MHTNISIEFIRVLIGSGSQDILYVRRYVANKFKLWKIKKKENYTRSFWRCEHDRYEFTFISLGRKINFEIQALDQNKRKSLLKV